MRRTAALLALLVLTAALAGCAEPTAPEPPTDGDGTTPPPPDDGGNGTAPGDTDVGRVGAMLTGDYRVTLATTKGNFTIDLWEDRAPLHAANFLQYAEDEFYQNTVFHRVMRNFVVQGGGFAAPFQGGATKPTHGPVPLEIHAENRHEVGTVGAARSQDPNSATSQWFVNTARNSGLDSGYTVFGGVVEGMETVRAIEAVPTATRSGHENVPAEDVVLRGVTVERPDAPAAPSLAAFRASYAVAPGGKVSIPLHVKNVGGERLDVALSGEGPAGATFELPHVPGSLSAGQGGVALLEVTVPQDFRGGPLNVQATGPGGTATVALALTPLSPGERVAGPANPRAQVHYVGLYDNGVVFDTTSTGLAARGFTLPGGGWSEHPDPLKVWVGSQQSDTGGYTPVIPGFGQAVVGLQPGETRTVRLSPDEGYRDGNWRIFEITLVSLD